MIPPSLTLHDDVSTLSPRKLFEHGLVNYTPLMALLVGLALGQCERYLEKINDSANWPDYQSQYLAVIAARDIILRNSTHYPLFFQLMLADQLTVQHVSKACREFLSTYRVASNINTSSRRLFTKNIQRLLEGVAIGPYDLFLLNGDNIGFTVKGEFAAYMQFTLFQDIIIRALRLIEIHIHCPDDLTKQLSRVDTKIRISLLVFVLCCILMHHYMYS